MIDATGKGTNPGLWDMHAHYEQVEWGPIHFGVRYHGRFATSVASFAFMKHWPLSSGDRTISEAPRGSPDDWGAVDRG